MQQPDLLPPTPLASADSGERQRLLQAARAAFAAGDRAEANRLAQAVLVVDPANVQAIMIAAAVLLDTGRAAEAESCLRAALERQPEIAVFYKGLAETRARAGDAAAALAALERVVALEPRDAQAHHARADLLQAAGRYAEAVDAYQRALALNAAAAPTWNNLGTALRNAGRVDEARMAYARALALAPELLPALRNAAVLELSGGRPEQAEPLLRKAYAMAPSNVEVLLDLGNTLKVLGRPEEAAGCYRALVELHPEDAAAHNNLGAALQDSGDAAAAIPHYERAVALRPDDVEAWDNLGNAQRWSGRLPEAAQSHRRALAIDPGFFPALEKLVLIELMLCAYQDLDAHIAELLVRFRSDRSSRLMPLLATQLPTTREDQLEAARRTWHAAPGVANAQAVMHPPERRRQKPVLRVAYLSADYHLHATSHLVAELFELHDRSRVEAFAYSTGPADDSAVRARIIAGAYAVREFKRASADAIVSAALADGIDILIDFNGHTIGGRFDVFARRPAPIQASWLVFPGTVGGDAIDYLIADAFVVPPEHASAYAEHLVYLPQCYQINDRRRAHPPAPPRKVCQLPEEALVFACFNHAQKIAPKMFAIWMRLLSAIPDSVLWLLTSNATTQEDLRDAARAHGVVPERLVFAPPKSVPAHLARLQLADLFLDTLPYNAHTTASDALWMGVPLVTCVGDTFASRVAGSLLRAVGMNELITASLADYEALALALARDRPRLRELRARLEAARATCPLFDTPRFVRGLERAYRMMWDRYAAGLPPAPLVVEDVQ